MGEHAGGIETPEMDKRREVDIALDITRLRRSPKSAFISRRRAGRRATMRTMGDDEQMWCYNSALICRDSGTDTDLRSAKTFTQTSRNLHIHLHVVLSFDLRLGQPGCIDCRIIYTGTYGPQGSAR
jgi:hypothetical protein